MHIPDGFVTAPLAVTGAAVAAAGLLLAFSAAIGVALARGRRVECHCFGALSAAPAGPAALARNAALVGAAGVVAAAGPGTSLNALDGAWNAVAVLGIALALVLGAGGVAPLRILRAHGRSLARVERLERVLAEARIAVPRDEPGLPVGAPAPALERLPSSGVPVLLLFTAPGCAPCESLAPDIARWQASDALAVLELDAREERELFDAYQAAATPGAVLISPDGVVARPLATGPDAIRALVQLVLDGPRRGLPPGTPVEPLPVTAAADGSELDLATLGEDAVLVFWNPGCGYCRAMEPALRAWADASPPGAARVVLVSSGGASDGLEALTVLDPGFSVGRFFGATGTPMAVRLDADGRVASRLATGADAALALARPSFPLTVVTR
jgi:thiol-disulfide isomerase/thioredoxin